MCRTIVRCVWMVMLLLAPAGMQAGKLEKAFEALRIHNYFLARELFQGQVKKHPAAAWYGLSVITGRADNPFFQVDSSHRFIREADSTFLSTAEKERTAIAKLGVDAAAIAAQRAHVYEVAWAAVGEQDRVPAYDRFIADYAAAPQQAEAVHRRDALAFEAARAVNTAAAYVDFVDRYPNSERLYEARSRMHEAVYREGVSNGTVPELERFLQQHPESPYVREAEDALFKQATAGRSTTEYRAFIRRYPSNPNVGDAWRGIYENSTRELSVGNITQFLKDNPDYPFIHELVDDYKVAGMVLYPFRQGGKWGFLDASGEERIKAQYEFVEPFVNGQSQVGLDGRVGVIDKMGKVAVPITYDDVADAQEGLFVVERGDRSGLMDRGGREVVPLNYAEIGEFSEGLADAAKDGRYGYIDVAGREVLLFAYEAAMPFHNGLAVVKQGSASGVVDKRGEVVVPFQYEWIEDFTGPVARVRRDGRMGVISGFGDVLLPVEHEHVGPFNEGLALVIDKGKCGYIDRSGSWVVPQQYEANAATPGLGDFHNGVARVMTAGKYGLIDTLGVRVFPFQYADIGLLEGDVVPVRKRTKWGYASRTYATLAEAKYDQAWELHEGHARVKVGELFGLIDSTGKEVVPPKYAKLGDVKNGLLVATLASGTGLIDPAQRIIVPLMYTAVEPVDADVVKVFRGERFAYLNRADGRFLWKEDGFDTAPSAEEGD